MNFFDRSQANRVEPSEPAPLRALPLKTVSPPPSRPLPPCPGAHIEAGTYDRRDDLLVDQALADAFLLHLARHLSPRLRARRPPRLFCVVGPGGYGKTESLLALGSRYGVDTLLLAGSDLLPGPEHGASIAVINRCFEYMHAASARSGRHFVKGLDDADSSILPEQPNVERCDDTANTCGKMQSICNSPDRYTDAHGVPIPMWWTVNSTKHFRSTLIRPGRCQIYNHEPDLEHKQRVVDFVYKPADRERKALRKFVSQYAHRPISFFTDLRNDLANEATLAVIKREGLDIDAIDEAAASQTKLNINALWAAAAQRERHKGGDFLTPRI